MVVPDKPGKGLRTNTTSAVRECVENRQRLNALTGFRAVYREVGGLVILNKVRQDL